MVLVKNFNFVIFSVSAKTMGKKTCLVTFETENKNALTATHSLACLKIRSRNEEAINSHKTGFTR